MTNRSGKFSRRSFIKQTSVVTAGVVGFPYLVPSSVLGKDGAIAPSNRLVMAQIGCGSMGSGNLRGFLDKTGSIQVVALCDVDDNNANNLKKSVDDKYSNRDCRTYRDYNEMLENENLDVVSHALPDHWHALVTIACARKGLDMYGEKPFARSIKEGRAMIDAIERYGLIWQTGSWQRSVEHFHRAANLVHNGRIGKIEYVEVGLPDGETKGPGAKMLNVPAHFDWQQWLGPAPYRPYQDFGRGSPHWDWRWIMDYSGGQLTDWAGHHIDIAHWGLGMDRSGPVQIEGKGKYPTEGIYDVPYAYDFTCTYANGVKFRVANSGVLPHGMGACWYGETGWVHVDRKGLSASDPKILREKIGPNEKPLYYSRDHKQNFIDCVKNRTETITPPEAAHRSISVGLLGEIAMLTGRKLNWNPKTEEFSNDEAANRLLLRSYRSPLQL